METDTPSASHLIFESETLRENLFESIPLGIALFDPKGGIFEANQAFANIFVMTRPQLIGQNFWHFTLEGEAESVQTRLQSIRETHADFEAVIKVMRADGAFSTLQTRWSGLAGKDSFVVVCEDVSARLLVQVALEEQSRITRMRADINLALARAEDHDKVLQDSAEALFKHLDMAFARIWTLDPDGETLILRASAGLYTHLNGAHGRVKVGQFKIGRIALSRAPHLTNDVLNDTEISDPEWARTEKMIAFAGYPLILEGDLLGVMAMFSRKTLSQGVLDELATTADGIAQWVKRKRAEEALTSLATHLEQLVEERTANLLQANEHLQTFTYSVAHDFRQQIRGISLNASLLLEDAREQLSENDQIVLQRLVYSARQLGMLTDGLLQYTRLGHQHPKRSHVDVSALLHEIVNEIQANQPELGQIEVAIQPEMATFADPSMVRIALGNLIDNAFKFTAGFGSHISVGCKEGSFFVADDGAGFDAKYSHKLFQPMERLHSDKFPGTGIGLANVRRIAEKHSGTVRGEGAIGHGATFYVSFEGTAPPS
jgi:PAS domain S-box-containing protein